MNTPISYQELDQVAGEVLPERAVLSTVTPIVGNGGGGGGDHWGGQGTTAVNACQSTTSAGTPGLVGALGLGSNNPGTTFTCEPGMISGH